MAARTSKLTPGLIRRLVEPPQRLSVRRTICESCRTALSTQPRYSQTKRSTPTPLSLRPFSTSIPLSKKSSTNPKSARKSPSIDPPNKKDHVPDNKHQRNLDSEPDPYDHSALQSAIDDAIARLKDALSKTRDAGRVSVQMIEDLPVDLNIKNPSAQGSSSHKERTKLRDIASVVPKGGRTMQVYLSEEAHVKPVTAAIQASQQSLTPQADAQNPLLLNVPVPPVTAETRAQAVAEAKKCFDKASLDVRSARGDAQKRHKKMEQEKLVVPDELRKAHKSMEDVAKKGQDEVKKVHDAAVKALQSS